MLVFSIPPLSPTLTLIAEFMVTFMSKQFGLYTSHAHAPNTHFRVKQPSVGGLSQEPFSEIQTAQSKVS